MGVASPAGAVPLDPVKPTQIAHVLLRMRRWVLLLQYVAADASWSGLPPLVSHSLPPLRLL